MSLTDLKKELRKLDKSKIIDLISDMYKKHKPIKEYLDFYVNPDEGGLIEAYHDKILDSFYPTRGQINIKKAKDAISTFKKLDVGKDSYADLLLFYVETGINFTNDFGELDSGFYIGLCKFYIESLTIFSQERQLENIKDRAHKVMANTINMTWGLHENLTETFNDFFPDYFEEDEDSKEISGNKGNQLRRV